MSRMTLTANGCTPLPQGRATPRRPFADLAVAVFDRIGEWHDRAQQRRLLAAASDHLLYDIGISRADVDEEVEKPFWRK
jgi:uncharacterized protein YjiS (DUF1127 family)